MSKRPRVTTLRKTIGHLDAAVVNADTVLAWIKENHEAIFATMPANVYLRLLEAGREYREAIKCQKTR